MKRKCFVKKMTSWIRGGGILLLSNISLVSVGFASWTIGNNDGVSVGIIVDADADVIDINRYIAYSKQADFFEFCKDGIISDGVLVSSGDIVVPFEINLNDDSDKISNHLADGVSSFSFKASVSTTGISAITPYLKSVTASISSTAYSSNYSYSSTSATESSNYVSTFSTSDGLDSSHLYFRVKYNFQGFPVGDDFNTNVYSKLGRGSLFFNFNAEVI